MSRPTLYVLAGPNGAGKSTLYETHVTKITDAEFVNADLLARAQFGRPAETDEESLWGQDAAERRRDELMAARKSLVVETVFSHPSKLELVRCARALGYRVVVFHVGVASAEDSVQRVAHRVSRGGHPVPEDRIRARFERNGPLIREAVREADRAFVYDNSQRGPFPVLVAEFSGGLGRRREKRMPEWAERLYGDVLPPPRA